MAGFQWLVGGKTKAQGRGKRRVVVTCHRRQALFPIYLSILAFCLDEGYS